MKYYNSLKIALRLARKSNMQVKWTEKMVEYRKRLIMKKIFYVE
jgi:hypothetical protein